MAQGRQYRADNPFGYHRVYHRRESDKMNIEVIKKDANGRRWMAQVKNGIVKLRGDEVSIEVNITEPKPKRKKQSKT
jgi:hypothetical protein